MLEIYIYGNSSVKIHPDNLVEEDSVFGHPAVQDVICVGAVDSGNLQKSIASYSSRGPVSIYYPEYELRNKIDLSGPGSESFRHKREGSLLQVQVLLLHP